jgi:hypothetical protein
MSLQRRERRTRIIGGHLACFIDLTIKRVATVLMEDHLLVSTSRPKIIEDTMSAIAGPIMSLIGLMMILTSHLMVIRRVDFPIIGDPKTIPTTDLQRILTRTIDSSTILICNHIAQIRKTTRLGGILSLTSGSLNLARGIISLIRGILSPIRGIISRIRGILRLSPIRDILNSNSDIFNPIRECSAMMVLELVAWESQ